MLHCEQRDTEVTARALVECMQLQGQLYDEWLEIMSDYATVFSEDRGLSQDGTDSASATVMCSVCAFQSYFITVYMDCCRFLYC